MVGNKYDVGDRVTFRLMKRERGSLYVRPYDSWQSTGSELLYNINGQFLTRIGTAYDQHFTFLRYFV